MASLSSSFQTSTIFRKLHHHEKEPLICVVCGSIARGFNFDAITCMSCKIFFRRNAFMNLTELSCRHEGHCQMTQQTRKYCTYCRLLTCFRVGMKRELFRTKKDQYFNRMKINKTRWRKQLRLTANRKFPQTLDLSQWSDRSILSNHDWLLLHQLSSTFDSLTDHVISKAHEIHHQLSFIGIQPLKMRVKAIYIYDMANTFANVVLEYIKSIPQFISLAQMNQQILLIRNIEPMIMFYAYYQMNLKPIESLTQTSYWLTLIECFFLPSTRYLHDIIKYLINCISSIDPYFIKLILILLAFSTNNIHHDEIASTHHLDEYDHAFKLHNIQNIYVELMWKYMLHQFGEDHAIQLYYEVIKNILQIQSIVSMMKNSRTSFEQKFYDNIIKLIGETLQFNHNI